MTSSSARPSTSPDLPRLNITKRAALQIQQGRPWIFSNDLVLGEAAKALPPGAQVVVGEAQGPNLGQGFFNRHSLIAFRLLAAGSGQRSLSEILTQRLSAALALRAGLFDVPYYRLVHAEGDGLPGLVVDRFDDLLVAQINGAGMEAHHQDLIAALREVVAPKTIILRRDAPVRTQEGLEIAEAESHPGPAPGQISLLENGLRFFADPAAGQKTGWFFDQRENRRLAAKLIKGVSQARVLDCYCHSGGFALSAAAAGATQVIGVDRAGEAIELAEAAARENGLTEQIKFLKADVFNALERMGREDKRFDLVITDPPAFVKAKKTLASGQKGYRKLARLAAALVAPGGFMVAASCSHHVGASDLLEQVRRGLGDVGRSAQLLHAGAADMDHPVHPALPETAYLKALFLKLD